MTTAAPSGHDTILDQSTSGMTVRQWIAVDPTRTESRIRRLLVPFLDHVIGLKTHGAENIPADGAFLIAANHSSWYDPLYLCRGQNRLIRFMTKSQAFTWPVVHRILRSGGGFPVRRGQSDDLAIEIARRLLQSGQPVGMFPEGTRTRDVDGVGRVRAGVARLAIETEVPVVCAAIYGVKPHARRRGLLGRIPKVTVVVGEAERFVDADVEAARQAIEDRMSALYDQARALHKQR